MAVRSPQNHKIIKAKPVKRHHNKAPVLISIMAFRSQAEGGALHVDHDLKWHAIFEGKWPYFYIV